MKKLIVGVVVAGLVSMASPALAKRDDPPGKGCSKEHWRIAITTERVRLCLFSK